MKSILVPTDFSDSAEKALQFAIMLAKGTGADIWLMYVRTPVFPLNVLPEEVIKVETEEIARSTRQSIHILEGMIRYAGGLRYELILEEGDPGEVITEIALSRQPDLIVMGSGKRKTIGDFIFGGTATKVVGNAARPVMVVPPEFQVSGKITRISYASNFYFSDMKAIVFVAEIARAFDAELCIVHVSVESREPEKEVKQFNLFMKEISEAVNYSRLSSEMLTGDNVTDALGDYIENGKTALMVLSTRTRKSFARLIGNSVTSEMLRKNAVPVIAFRHQSEVQVSA